MIGQTISHFRVLEKLGRGGMGVVYRVLGNLRGKELEGDESSQRSILGLISR